jgi:hypothetical protein
MDDMLYEDDFNIDNYVRSHELLLTDNRFITNLSFMDLTECASNLSFYRNKFERIDGFDSQYVPFIMGYWRYSAVNNRIIDSIAGPGVALSLPPMKKNMHDTGHLQLFFGVSSQRVYKDAATGAPLTNRSISWQTDGGEFGSFVTDGSGEAYREWFTTRNEYKPHDPVPTRMSQVHNSTVTFTVAGYSPVTKNIADIKGTGAAILFGNGTTPTTPPPTTPPPTTPPPTTPPPTTPPPTTPPPTTPPPTTPNNDDLRLDKTDGFAWRDANTILMHFYCVSASDSAEIYRAEAPDGPYQLVKTLSGETSIIDSGLKPNTTYYYKIRFTKGTRQGPLSAAIAIKTDDIKVTYFLGFGGANSTIIHFYGNCASEFAEIYRSESPSGPFQLVRTVRGENSYSDTGLKASTTYYYKVRFSQWGYFGQFSDVIGLKTEDLLVTYFIGFGGANSTLMHFYGNGKSDLTEVYRSESPSGPFQLVQTVSGESSYTDTGLSPNTAYYYKVRFSQAGAFGPLSDVLILKTT